MARKLQMSVDFFFSFALKNLNFIIGGAVQSGAGRPSWV